MKSIYYFLAGLIILLMNKVRYFIRGYRQPKPFSVTDIDRAVEYDENVVSTWKDQLRNYTGTEEPFLKKTVLELGPGSDIGTGVLMIDQGAKEYIAFDRFNLASNAPQKLYDLLFRRLRTETARNQLKSYIAGNQDNLSFLSDPKFDLVRLEGKGINQVVSQAAFEHFETPQKVISQLSRVVQPGTVLCAEIDLRTHSRWIRDIDPNNIYRYPNWLYKFLRYDGIPNRVRSEQYRDWLAANGWKNIRIFPLQTVDKKSNRHTLQGLSRAFYEYDMKILTFVLLATKK